MIEHTAARRLVIIALLSTFLAACGGGGGSSNPAPAAQPAGDGGGTVDGGTGVYVTGTVTGFGSVIVDGQRFGTEEASVEVGGEAGTETDLRVGQQVEVSGSRDADGILVAESIRYQADVKGPVQEIDVEAGTLVVAGQAIQTGVRTRFDGVTLDALVVDDIVEVSGRRDRQDVIFARYVEREDDLEVEVTGPVAALDADARTFRIGGLEVNYADASVDPTDLTLENGLIVEVEGNLEGATLAATEVEADDDLGERIEAGTEVEIEGLIESIVSDDSFMIRGLAVRFDASTEFDDGGPDNIAVGVALEVEGSLDADGVLVATEIEFEDFDDRDASVELEGRVDAVSDDSIELLGLTITVDSRTRLIDDRDDMRRFSFADLVVGDIVEVGAVQQGDLLLAVKIEREENDEAVDIDGFLDSFDAVAGTLVVSGVTVDGNSADFDVDGGAVTAEQFFMLAEIGAEIEVEGTYDGTAFIASEIELDRRIDVEIEAELQSVGEDSIGILGITIAVDALTRLSDDRDDIEDFQLIDLEVGNFVEVEAVRVDGTQLAVKIQRKEEEQGEVELSGFLDSLDAVSGRIVVSGVAVETAGADIDLNGNSITAATFFEQGEIGASVEVEGSFDGEVLSATEVAIDN